MKPICLTFLTLAMSISLQSYGQKIPRTWSPSVKINAHYGGGMMYYSYDILITDTSSYMKVVSDKGEKTYKRKFTSQELNSILAYLEAHRFDKIKSEDTGPTHDKASESITLRWEDNVIGASEGYAQRITDEYRADFNEVQAYIEGLFRKDK